RSPRTGGYWACCRWPDPKRPADRQTGRPPAEASTPTPARPAAPHPAALAKQRSCAPVRFRRRSGSTTPATSAQIPPARLRPAPALPASGVPILISSQIPPHDERQQTQRDGWGIGKLVLAPDARHYCKHAAKQGDIKQDPNNVFETHNSAERSNQLY